MNTNDNVAFELDFLRADAHNLLSQDGAHLEETENVAVHQLGLRLAGAQHQHEARLTGGELCLVILCGSDGGCHSRSHAGLSRAPRDSAPQFTYALARGLAVAGDLAELPPLCSAKLEAKRGFEHRQPSCPRFGISEGSTKQMAVAQGYVYGQRKAHAAAACLFAWAMYASTVGGVTSRAWRLMPIVCSSLRRVLLPRW